MQLMRLKNNVWIREMMSETEFTTAHLIQPLFVVEGLKDKTELKGLDGNFRWPVADIHRQVEADIRQGVRHFLLFFVPKEKRLENFQLDFAQKVLRELKEKFGKDAFFWVDTCLCSFTEHGHCCLFNSKDQLDIEKSLQELARSSLAYAQAGADGISPSDMMDGRTKAIRKILDESYFSHIPIMSYSTKFASHFYGPFREAAQSAPQFGDRKNYQLDVRSNGEALRSAIRCAEEGADLLMVKPGMTSIDLIHSMRNLTNLSVGAYQVSGEYASLCLLAREGLIDFSGGLLETWNVFRRAGSQYIITYGARLAHSLEVKKI